MSAKTIQPIQLYMAVTFDGSKSWGARRLALQVIKELEINLRTEGFTVLNFKSDGLPFDPCLAEDTIGSFIELADIVVYFEGEPFAGLDGIAAAAVKRHNSVTKCFQYFPATGHFV